MHVIGIMILFVDTGVEWRVSFSFHSRHAADLSCVYAESHFAGGLYDRRQGLKVSRCRTPHLPCSHWEQSKAEISKLQGRDDDRHSAEMYSKLKVDHPYGGTRPEFLIFRKQISIKFQPIEY